MADLEDVTLDGRPLQSLRVADLKAALEERGLSKSGQKNALIKRLKGALMLENLQRTSTAHVGLQPNSQIGEEMSQNSFIKQYLAKQQELLRQRLEREAREAYETNDQEDHNDVNNSACPPQVQDASPAVIDHFKPPGPSSGQAVPEGLSHRHQEAAMSRPPASGSVAQDRSEAPVDSDEDDSEDGEEDGGDDDDDDWDNKVLPRQPVRAPMVRERSAASCQPQQQHMPSLLSPQLRQPTPPPSPPPELSFPLPDTPKQSPPSPDEAPSGRSPSSSSSGSSSSGSRSSSPEPHGGHAERKPGPLTLLARKMESEGAFSGAEWHSRNTNRQDNCSSVLFPNQVGPEGLVSSGPHLPTVSHAPVNLGSIKGHAQVPISVLKATAERDAEVEREKALELRRQEQQRKLEQERALDEERVRAEQQKALEKEQFEQEQALEREKALQMKRELALEREKREREVALAKERERQSALEIEVALQREQEEREREEQARAQALERERALEQERFEKKRALEAEKIERERMEREKVLEQERLEQERLERERALERERLKKERMEREQALKQERIEQERALELEQERVALERIEQRERIERENALERERIEREKALERENALEREKALERERIERERIEREKALELERIEREMALERERIEREMALEQEGIEREKALEQERIEREKALEQERMERERALERERIAQEKALEQERMERKKALEKEKMEEERAEREATLERERLEKVEQGRLELERVQEQERRALNEDRKAKESTLELEKRLADSLEKKSTAHEKTGAEESRMTEVESEEHFPLTGEIGFVPTPTPLSTGISTDANKQEGEVHGPVTCEGQSEESNKSSPSIFKKFKFTRNTPLQPHAASRIIRRPRTFSDTPTHSAPVISDCNAESQLQKDQSADADVDDTGRVISKIKHVEATESVEKDGDSNLMAEDKEDHEVKGSIKTAVDNKMGPSGRGRDTKKTEKKETRRSSNDLSSSESDSSSSHSTGSSSSVGKAYPSQPRRDDSSFLQVIEVSKEQEKMASIQMEISSEKLNEAPTHDAGQRRKDFYNENEKPENSQGEFAVSEPEKGIEGNETPKAFSTRKISLSSSKSSPGSTENDHELGSAGGRKRRWGSSTAVTAKKPSISITTDSLKSLIPDIKPALNQEVMMDLHPEDPVLSETEDEDKNHADQELQICRTVTQVVNVENQENGQKEAKIRREESDEEDMQDEKETKSYDEDPTYLQAIEAPSPLHTRHKEEINTVTPSDIPFRRSISQQKMGVSITIDDPVRTARQPSPPRGDVSNIVHVCNLVRPFTLGQLKELLSRTGTLVEDGFWIDKIKSHCYVTYSSSEEAVATRAALHGVKWPQSNPKVLRVDFCHQDELDFHKGLGSGERPGIGVQSHNQGLPSLLPERDQWAEREREMGRRERARAEREWDRDKVREFGKSTEEKEAGAQRSSSREKSRKESAKGKEKKTEKKEKAEDPPAKLLDDLFRKTKAVPCIYWLPLTEEQYLQREMARVERRKEREKQRKKDEEEAEQKKKEEENKEKMRAGGGGGITVDRSENENDKIRDRARGRGRDRERDREVDKRREGYRRPGGYAPPSGRRSRSRSDPRERRR
ncbi:uncharacterized protein acin1a [Eucyclogobius newberryi]|uniref:uncharacterized protein acin1a n=1 Tax=Eucyclogobius newberryi TaxID=166745 RepID=UPI003B59B29F